MLLEPTTFHPQFPSRKQFGQEIWEGYGDCTEYMVQEKQHKNQDKSSGVLRCHPRLRISLKVGGYNDKTADFSSMYFGLAYDMGCVVNILGEVSLNKVFKKTKPQQYYVQSTLRVLHNFPHTPHSSWIMYSLLKKKNNF